ncbi:hypothetical protein [Phaeocystidibacter marisrubri]|uniref:Uncharacterized protein n=1 Tax=Phaeocystidibacter marisrubri TaxID=1577780 RepID=A0A6L3ZIL7_9FLAO|nr:hypothetical protein [Phaeocystidibacter marisrubri]KAB2817453.1 hypothetical protein F8C82_03390 [Phaeocystidibacter marisrubri]GGH75269.1 hypothetical protein GCM10011318_22130 [Phaeocystidibacter marisrubri]
MRNYLSIILFSLLLLQSCGTSYLKKDVNRLIYRAELKNCKSDTRAEKLELRLHVKYSYQSRKVLSPLLDSIYAHELSDTLLMREVYLGGCVNCPFHELDIFTSQYVIRVLHHPLNSNPFQVDTLQYSSLTPDLESAHVLIAQLHEAMRNGIKWWDKPARITLPECEDTPSNFNFFIIALNRRSYSYLRDCTGLFP